MEGEGEAKHDEANTRAQFSPGRWLFIARKDILDYLFSRSPAERVLLRDEVIFTESRSFTRSGFGSDLKLQYISGFNRLGCFFGVFLDESKEGWNWAYRSRGEECGESETLAGRGR